MKRHAPAGGYVGGTKQHYRRSVYATFKRMCSGVTADKKLLLMPSIEGDEIVVARQNGFRDENMYIVDKNPAIAATISRRNHRLAACFGCTTDDAAARLARAKTAIDVANLDYTGCVSRELLTEIARFGSSGVLAERSTVAVTVQRGRERPFVFASMTPKIGTYAGDTDHGRIVSIVSALEYGGAVASVVRREVYRSTAGNLTMLWVCIDLHALSCRCSRCVSMDTHIVTNTVGLKVKDGAGVIRINGASRATLREISESVSALKELEAIAYATQVIKRENGQLIQNLLHH